MWNHNNPIKENDGGPTEHGSFGIITQARYGRRRGLSAGSPACPGGRHHGRRGFRDAEVSAQIGAEHGERSSERVTYRNGYRNRTWDTRVGTMALHLPKVREGSYFPCLLEPRRRSEKALLTDSQQAYVEGVSTRRVDDLIKALGCDGISSSPVSRICVQLDEVWRVSWVVPWTAVPIPTYGWTV